jgi:hypothetical protein
MKKSFAALLFVLCASSAFAKKPKAPPCQITFSVVWRDQLNNLNQGLVPKDVKWFESQIQKKYPNVCYKAPSPDVPVVFFIGITTETYRGGRTLYSADSNSTTTTVPLQFEYPVLTLSVETLEGDKVTVHQNFRREGICRVLSVVMGMCDVHQDIIEDAAKWVANGGLTNPLQGTVQ